MASPYYRGAVSNGAGWGGYEVGGVVRISPSYGEESAAFPSVSLQDASSPRHHHGYLRTTQLPPPGSSEEKKNVESRRTRTTTRSSPRAPEKNVVLSGAKTRRSIRALLSPRKVLGYLSRAIGFFFGDTSSTDIIGVHQEAGERKEE